MVTAVRDEAQGRGTSLYVHVPFCVVKCGYCDFNSYVARGHDQLDRFLSALEEELRARPLAEPPVSVFVGGGTPTHLDPGRLRRLFAILGQHVDLQRCVEVTMEANPESVTQEKAGIAREAGVVRVSMGVQSFEERHLRFLDRAHDAARAEAAFGDLRRAGFDNVSIDLIFGIPGQTLAEWSADLARAIALRPDHVSAYNLTFEPGTVLHRDLVAGRVQRNDEELDREMFLHTRQTLLGAGFDAYEISNFAGRGGPCRHNDHYWLQGDYLGVGPGASSHRGGVRWTNLKALDAWADAAMSGLPPIASAETLTRRQRAGEAIWLGLRRRDGIDLQRISQRIGGPVEDWCGGRIGAHVADGHLAREGTCIRLTDTGLLLGDRIGSDFLVP